MEPEPERALPSHGLSALPEGPRSTASFTTITAATSSSSRRLTPFQRTLFWLRLIVIVAWTATLLTGVIYKAVTASFLDYVQHLTNWSWTIQALFYLLETLAHLDSSEQFALFNVTFLFWLANGVSWAVFWLMFVVLSNNPQLFQQISTSGGIPMGVVYDGDRLFHVIPSVVNLVYLFLSQRLILRSVATFSGPRAPLAIAVIFGVYATVAAPLVPVGIYLVSFDPQKVYGLTVHIWVLVLVGIASLVVFNAVPFAAFVAAAYSVRDGEDPTTTTTVEPLNLAMGQLRHLLHEHAPFSSSSSSFSSSRISSGTGYRQQQQQHHRNG